MLSLLNFFSFTNHVTNAIHQLSLCRDMMITAVVEEVEDMAAAVDTADEAAMTTIAEVEDMAVVVVDMMITAVVEEVEDMAAVVDTADEAAMMTIAEVEDMAVVVDMADTKSVAHTVFVRIMVSCLEILIAVGRF